jgi:DNA-binding GntR family transcriptional regulator
MIDNRSFDNPLDMAIEHQDLLNSLLEGDVDRARKNLANHMHTLDDSSEGIEEP